MKIPKRMLERAEKIVRCRNVLFSEGALKCRPLSRQNSQGGETALRVVKWTRAAQTPQF